MSVTMIVLGVIALVTSWWWYGSMGCAFLILVLITIVYNIYKRNFEYTFLNNVSKANNNCSSNNNSNDFNSEGTSGSDAVPIMSDKSSSDNSINAMKNCQDV